MASTGFKGTDVRQTGTALVFRALLQTSTGALLGTGTTTISIQEWQSDGTIKSYDFNDNTFKTTALTTPTLAMTHRPSNNAATTTGLWSVALSTLTGFTVGAMYIVICNNTGAAPTDQAREFQYGSAEGDLQTTAVSTGIADLSSALDFAQVLPTAPVANTVGEALFLADILGGRFGTAQAGAASSITLDAGASSVANSYVGYMVYLYGGTGGGVRGVGQSRTVIAYDTATKIATVDRPWGTNPDNTSKFMLLVHPSVNVTMWQYDAAGIAVDANHLPKVDLEDWKGATAPANTGDAYARIGANGAGLSNITLPSGGLANVTAWTVAITGNITGNLSGSVGSLTTNNDKTGYSLANGSFVTATFGTCDFTSTMKTSITTAATAATPTINATQAFSNTGTWTGNVSGSVGSVTGNVGGIAGTTQTLDSLQTALSAAHGAGSWATATSVTVSDKTGFKLASDGLAAVVAWTVNITGNLSGSVGSVTADVGITQAGADKVWGTAARVLTAGTNIVLAKGVGLTGLNDIAATAIVSAGAITTLSGAVVNVTNLTNAPTAGDFTATMKTSLNAATPTVSLPATAPSGFLTAASISAAAYQTIADNILVRDWAATTVAVGQPARRSLMSGIRKFVNHTDTTTSPGFIFVTREDDTTEAYSQSVIFNSSAELVTSVG